MITALEANMTGKQAIIDALRKWIKQRPGLDFGNYGDVKAYRQESRNIQADGRVAKMLLATVECSSITEEELVGAFRAFGGRLEWDGKELSYCTGQYWPTEYRRAACAVLAQALWDHYRDMFSAQAKEGESAGDAIRRQFRQSFGRAIQQRLFN